MIFYPEEVCGRVLFELSPKAESVKASRELFESCDELKDALASPAVEIKEKEKVIDRLFPQDMRNFLKVMCQWGHMDNIMDIFDAYDDEILKSKNILKAELYCVCPPEKAQTDKIKETLKKKYGVSDVLLEVNIISVLKSEIADFEAKTQVNETGRIISINDGIVNIYGLNHAMYGELVEFETGVKGIVQNVERKTLGCVLLGSDHGLTEGSKVVRTKKRAGVGVGEKLLGRVVDALGAPIDGMGEIEYDDYYPIEREAAGVCNRKSVTVPLETGILSIDSMFPIGRGQRELIIGDRQTGKTSIALDTILNQKGKDMICVYVAIGQKASTVAKFVEDLKKHGAMDYTIVVTAMASDLAPLQYICPYAGTAMAEYFMDKGKDVLIVYDDLSKHAVAYRAMSLLLKRSPGREAYPGDVFYLHSRLLERSCRLDDAHGGGSITALPIIETQAGDVSAYIPTNVISITDGQIFLETELFFSGVRPAVNVGLSVSRVGGAAQTKIVKKVSGNLRIDLAQFREMEVFTQFSSELDKTTQELLDHGHRLVEILKQPLYHPYSMHEEVIILCCAQHKLLLDVPVKEIRKFTLDMLSYFEANHSDIIAEINDKKVMTDELDAKIVAAAKEFKQGR